MMKLHGWLIVVLVLVVFPADRAAPGELSETEKQRRELNDRYDKLGLRKKIEFVKECSPEFLKEPAGKKAAGEYIIAKVAPTVKLRILPNLDPEYFSGVDQYMPCWANWAHVTRSEDNRFYLAASDHMARGCDINLYEYRPADDSLKRVLDVGKLLGWSPAMFTDGKIHGQMGIMPDGTLWAATHHGVEPKKDWWLAGYRGSWLFSYNIRTGEAKNWGVPLIGNSLPCFAVDVRRGRFVGTGFMSTLLCWDCLNQKVRFAGYPPQGWVWWERAMLCDEATGIFWGMDASAEPYRLMSFDPERNRFQRYELFVPENPFDKKVQRLRGCTRRPAMDGYYYWATWNGALFKFKPEGKDGPEIVLVGVTWDKGRDVLQMAIGPNGRYIYYQPKDYPAPVVQFDVKTGRKKALCFLQDYFFEKYGYWLGAEVYGLEISNDGSFLVICENGTFSGREKSFGHPALAVVSIPLEERPME